MISLLVHAILGIVVIAVVVKLNPAIFKRVPDGPALSALEIAYWATGIVSLPLCWYFNIRYVYEYADNPFWGQGNWNQFIAMGYANWASSSQVADYTIINVILLPLFTVVDGRRRGIRWPILYLITSFFTSCVFAFAFYFATIERQRRHQVATSPAEFVT